MKASITAAKQAAERLTEANSKLSRIADQRAKFEAALTAAAQSVDVLRGKVGRLLALVAVGEAQQDAADKAAAELAAAERNVSTFRATLDGLAATEAEAQAAVAEARGNRAAAVRAGLDSHFDDLAQQYRQAAAGLVALHRRVLGLYLIRRSMGQPEDRAWSPFRSETEGREFRVPALNHDAFAADRAGSYGELVYTAAAEMFDPSLGAQAEATQAEIDLLRDRGLEV